MPVDPYCLSTAGVDATRRKLCWVARQNSAGFSLVACESAFDAASWPGCALNVWAIQTLVSIRNTELLEICLSLGFVLESDQLRYRLSPSRRVGWALNIGKPGLGM